MRSKSAPGLFSWPLTTVWRNSSQRISDLSKGHSIPNLYKETFSKLKCHAPLDRTTSVHHKIAFLISQTLNDTQGKRSNLILTISQIIIFGDKWSIMKINHHIGLKGTCLGDENHILSRFWGHLRRWKIVDILSFSWNFIITLWASFARLCHANTHTHTRMYAHTHTQTSQHWTWLGTNSSTEL